jgi:hypothetical protein
MAVYLDHHPQLPAIPAAQAKQMAANVKAGKRDDYGVKPMNVFMGDGKGWCLTDAPDVDSVVASHKAVGFPLRKSDVHEVKPLV